MVGHPSATGMEDSTLLFLLYVVATPVAAVLLLVLLRWIFRRFPSQTRRDLADLKTRVRSIEGIVEHIAKKDSM